MGGSHAQDALDADFGAAGLGARAGGRWCKEGALPNSAIGHGTVGTGVSQRNFDFDAFSDPLGQNAHGFAELFSPPTRPIRGPVTCLQVTGKTANIGGELLEPIELIGLTFTHYSVQVLDAHPDTPGPDLISSPLIWTGVAGGAETVFCTSHGSPAALPVTSGEITVVDAPPCDRFKDKPGTDKDKCKDKKDGAAIPPLSLSVPLEPDDQMN